MDASDDPKLDALLRSAAPVGAPEGLADRVLAMARARRRRGRLVRLAVAAAAVLALGVGLKRLHSAFVEPAERLVAKSESLLPSTRDVVAEAPEHSFAVVLPSTGDATHSVMMGRFNDRLVICARPKAAAGDEFGSAPRSMVGWVSVD